MVSSEIRSVNTLNSTVLQMLHDVSDHYKNFVLGVNKSVVLVLETRASGKSVLARLLTTNIDQINVNDINSEVNVTFVPTLMIDAITNTTFYDCPVIDDDATDITADITAALTIQKLLAYANEFKIVFVITAESMSHSVNDTDAFIQLAERAVNLIKDIRKYSDGIAVIVRTTDPNVDGIGHGDRELIGRFIEFLKRTQLKLARPQIHFNTTNSAVDNTMFQITDDQEEADERTNREKISFISALFKKDRIKILHMPPRAAAHARLQHQKHDILAMINNELRFVTKDDDDFLCKINEITQQHIHMLLAVLKHQMEMIMPKSIATLHTTYVQTERRDEIVLNVMFEILTNSERLIPNALNLPPNIDRNQVISPDLQRNFEIFEFLQQFNEQNEWRVLNITIELKNQLRHKIDNTFSNEMLTILNAVKTFYLQKTKQYYLEIDKITEIITDAHDKFAKTKSETREIFMSELLNVIADLEIDGLNGNVRRLLRNNEFIGVLNDVNYPIAEQLANEFVEWKQYFRDLKIWYEFLRELRDQLSLYANQQKKIDIDNVSFMNVYIIGDDDDTVGPHIIELHRPLSYLANDSLIDRNAIENVRVNRYMLKALQAIWSSSMSEMHISCDDDDDDDNSTNRIRIVGDFISIRHAIATATDCWSMAKQIDIFALNTVFIDADIDKRDDTINVTIVSPTIEIITDFTDQSRQILLIGKNISEILPNAQNGSIHSNRNGTQGSEGIRGGAGGNILCIGHWFINEAHLRIDVSGGKGGRGQIGGNGKRNRTKKKANSENQNLRD